MWRSGDRPRSRLPPTPAGPASASVHRFCLLLRKSPSLIDGRTPLAPVISFMRTTSRGLGRARRDHVSPASTSLSIRHTSKNRNVPMAQSIQPGRFGHSGKPDCAGLAKQEKEPIREPELPIIDTHHHLWDRGGWTYLLPGLLADLNIGHNIVATVFDDARSMYT